MKKNTSSKRKLITLIVSVVILVVAFMGTTVAYFTDSVENQHVITVGSVDAEQYVNGVAALVPEEYFIPAVKQGANKITLTANNGKTYETDEYANSKERIVTVENTGKSNAYFRTLVAVERLNKADEPTVNRTVAVFNDTGYTYETFDNVDIGGSFYTVYVATYTDVLVPDEISEASLLSLYLDPETTSADVYGVAEIDVIILTQAAQSSGFTSANMALGESFAYLTDANIAEQFD